MPQSDHAEIRGKEVFPEMKKVDTNTVFMSVYISLIEETGIEAQRLLGSTPLGICQRYVVSTSIMSV